MILHAPSRGPAPDPPAPMVPAAANPPAAGGSTVPAHGSEQRWQPPSWAPSLGAVNYVKEAVTALLLVLALPYVLWKLLTDPASLFRHAGRKHVDP